MSAKGALALCGDDRCDRHNAATPATCKEAEGVTVWPLQSYRHAVRLITGEGNCSIPCELYGHKSVTDMQLPDIFQNEQFIGIHSLLERVLCVPASSVPVERVFSQSGLIIKPNRARMSDALLEELVFLKCNDC